MQKAQTVLTMTALTMAAFAGFAAPAMAQDQYFEIINHSPRDLIAFHATPTHFSHWGPDLLGRYMIPVGNSMRVWIADNQTTCVYDVLFVMEGDYQIEGVQDICDLGTFVLR